MSCKQHWVRFDFILSVFKQMTAYEVRISDWSSDVCSSDLRRRGRCAPPRPRAVRALPHLWRLTDGKARNRNIAWRYGRGNQGDGQGRDGPSLDETARKSVVTGQSESERVDLGGRCIIKNKQARTIRVQKEHKRNTKN